MSPEKAITRDTKISEAMKICHEAPEIFNRHHMGCFVCMAASAETIEDGALMHNVDVQAIVDELNAACVESTER